MYIILGILATTAVILSVLYFFVFTKLHKLFSFIILSVISLLLIVSHFMHLILAGIFVFCIGIFLLMNAKNKKSVIKSN